MKKFNNFKFISLLLVSYISMQYGISQNLIIDSLAYKDKYRKIRVFKPKASTDLKINKKIIIMMDAQNLFENSTSYTGEWEVDETILNLPIDKQPIVIGIDHGNEYRLNELTPFPNTQYGGGNADEFLKWITNELMPYAENRFDLNFHRNNTVIAGSSLGGLFAHYAVITRNDLFGFAGVLSPSYWFSEKIYEITEKNNLGHNTKFFLSGGTKEDENLVAEIERMKAVLEEKSNAEVFQTIIPNGAHNEKQWKVVFQKFLEYLYVD